MMPNPDINRVCIAGMVTYRLHASLNCLSHGCVVQWHDGKVGEELKKVLSKNDCFSLFEYLFAEDILRQCHTLYHCAHNDAHLGD